MVDAAQKRAVRNYRIRLRKRGMTRFEVLGLGADRALIRAVARRLARNDAEAGRLRAELAKQLAGEPPRTGGILAALRRSPLVGVGLDLRRARETGRKVAL